LEPNLPKERISVSERNNLVLKYIPFVKYIANKIHTRLPKNVDLNDIQSIGMIGLIDAIDRFDPTRGVSFKSYAETRISGTIYDELRKQDTLPRSVRDRIKSINKAKEDLETKLGKKPTDKEISEYIGLDLDKYYKSLQKCSSGKTVYIEDDYNTFANIAYFDEEETYIANDDETLSGALDSWARTLFTDVIKTTLYSLPSEKKLILSLYYDENLSLKEISKLLYVSESRVSQIHANAILKVWINLSKIIKSKKQ